MNSDKRHVLVFLGALLAAAVLSGVAAAGNPHGTPPGQAKQSGSAPSGSPSSNATGVKPSSTTHHNTHAAAGSDATKLYGNGSTAGQIAERNGASADTDLYGPGNSQPHKAAPCPNGKHRVDVHALKAHGAGSCGAGSQASRSASTSTPRANGRSTGGTAAARIHAKAAFTPPRSARRGGVLGARHTVSRPVTTRAKPAHAVLGTANFTG